MMSLVRVVTHRGLDDWLTDDALIQLRVQPHVGPQLGIGSSSGRLHKLSVALIVAVFNLRVVRGC